MLRRSLYTLCALLLSLFLVGPRSVSAATEEEIETARKKGMEYLLSTQKADGSWEYSGHDVGITSLCAIALIENGVAVDDPVIEKAQRFVLDKYLDTTGTYDITLAILLLSRVGDRDNKTAIRDLAARLVAGQNTHGGWGYSCPKVRSAYLSGGGDRPKQPAGPGDNSCTQFAVLGLWVASRSGVNIDDAMTQVAYRFVLDQNKDGGWPYKADPTMPQGSRNSMTFAGLFCVTVARANRIRAVQQAEADGKPIPKVAAAKPRPAPAATTPDPNAEPNPDAPATPTTPATTDAVAEVVDPGADVRTIMEDPIFSRGLEMATKYAAGISPGSSRYFLWSVERMGVILALDKFGNTDWFAKGAEVLLAAQGKPAGEMEGVDGAWMIASTGSSLSETSFAILFLRKANLGSDITRLLQGDPLEPFQIVSQEAKPRFLKLEQAIAAARPGDVIRIDTNRPIDVPHILIDKDLTIEAGFGYNPVLRYDVGFDASGRRSDPKADASARYLIGVKAGTLTLEGLRLQMDPPKTISNVPWIGVAVEGGTLRMLNCSVSEAQRQGMAALQVSGAAKVELRNVLLVGGRAALEIVPSGEQQISVDNSVLFSNVCVSIPPEKSPGQKIALNLHRSALQGTEIFSFDKVATPVEITSNGVAYLGDALGMKFLRSRSGADGMRWSGKYNIYDVKKWVGFQGAPLATIRDAKTWSTFWGGADESGDSRVITFAGKRRQGAFGLDLSSDDFEFANNSQVYGNRRRTGINTVYCGPGYSYTLFREGYDYNEWKEGMQQLAQTP